jgi:hypothetical protein
MSQTTAVRAGDQTAPSDYQRGWRRMLVDMEIPAWQEDFLSRYDPIAMADLYQRARATSVMFVCKTLNGYCFWPTGVGAMHPRLQGRDVVGETITALRERDIAACAYYSVIFDNWPAEQHPEWQVELLVSRSRSNTSRDRHGHCCPNNPGYRGFIADQIADLYGRYEFGATFCDMTFWPGICGCRHCRDRFRTEAGTEIPEVIDWTSPEWCAFQEARERWIDEFTGFVTDAMRKASPGIAVYHNFAPAPGHWTWAVPFTVTEHCDFLGGDLYGDEIEQLLVMKLMNNLSRSRPVEYMTFATIDCDEHVRLKTAERMRAQVLGSVAESTAFMFIEAIDPVGTAADRTYDRIGETFESTAGWEPHLGGEAVEDVAVYFSNASKMDFAENGRAVSEMDVAHGYPHMLALRGVCRMLQRAHVPFGVITRRQLAELDRYRMVVLPNVARMDAEEVEAIREFVRNGGRVYASRYTSLVETRGVRHDDLMLADVFGVHVEGEEPTRVVYAKPATAASAQWLAPQRYLTADPRPGALDGGLLRLRAAPDAEVLATLTLPYAHPHVGSFGDENWASIHSFPPGEDTDAPVLVHNRFGSGRAVYSSLDIEREEADANDRLFASIVELLLDGERSVTCDTHPAVWVSAFRQLDDRAIRIVLRNGPPAIVTPATLQLAAPDGGRFVSLEELPSGRAVPFTLGAGGVLRCGLDQVPEVTMLLARYEDQD